MLQNISVSKTTPIDEMIGIIEQKIDRRKGKNLFGPFGKRKLVI